MSYVAIVEFFVIIGLIIALKTTISKLLAFDDLVDLLQHDIATNIKHFEGLMTTPVMMNSPEIQQLHKSMTIMHARFNEYLLQFSELRGKAREYAKAPVVVD